MIIDWPNTRAAVLGGGGFLGGHVVRALQRRGAEPIIPRTAEGWDFRVSSSVAGFFEQYRPQVVFNCAARQGGLEYQRLYPADIFYENLLMGLHTLHAAWQGGARKYVNIVAACSYPGYLDGVLSEDDYWSGPLHDSVVNYGFTKKAQVVIWGSGQPVREWLFVEDAAEAIIAAAERYDAAEPINVSVGRGLSISELALLISEVVGYQGELVYDSQKPEGALHKTFANDRIRSLVGWQPQTSLRDGVTRTLQWLESHYEQAVAAP